MSFLISTDDLEPRVKGKGWVLKVMDGMYDARQGRCREQKPGYNTARSTCHTHNMMLPICGRRRQRKTKLRAGGKKSRTLVRASGGGGPRFFLLISCISETYTRMGCGYNILTTVGYRCAQRRLFGVETLNTLSKCLFDPTFDSRAENVHVFDLRRRAEQASFAAEEDCFNIDAGLRKHASFPAFAYQHVKNRHGIMHMVRSVRLRHATAR